MPTLNPPLAIEDFEREVLKEWVRSTTIDAGIARRARVILLLSEGKSLREVRTLTGMMINRITEWRDRFFKEGIDGLYDSPRSGRPDEIPMETKLEIVRIAQTPPPEGLSHWTSGVVAKMFGVSLTTVQVLWRRAGIKPHRQGTYMASTDPDFVEKAADVIGLYMNPPENAVVFCVDEKSAIQALDRLQPLLPLQKGLVERRGFEYERKGISSLYAALDVETGKVTGECSPRHRSVDLVRFLKKVVKGREKKEVHIIMDNLSAHKTKTVKEWLKNNPNVTIHYTPTYSSWLNQVEIWFSIITSKCIRRGSFSSVKDLVNKIMAFIKFYNKDCKPFRWSYDEPSRRIRVSLIKNA
jgi:transposase